MSHLSKYIPNPELDRKYRGAANYADKLHLTKEDVPEDITNGLIHTAATWARKQAKLEPIMQHHGGYPDYCESFSIDISWSWLAQAYQRAYMAHHYKFYPHLYII